MSKKIYEVHVYDNGNKYWRLNGKLHREDGPAMEFGDGTEYFWLNDKCLSEKQHKAATSKKDDCSGKVVEFEGKKYKLVSLSGE